MGGLPAGAVDVVLLTGPSRGVFLGYTQRQRRRRTQAVVMRSQGLFAPVAEQMLSRQRDWWPLAGKEQAWLWRV